EWELSDAIKIGPDGTAKVPFEKLASSQLWVRDATKKQIAIAAVSPVSLLKNDLNIRLKPECKMMGTIECDQFKKLRKAIDWTALYLNQDGNSLAFSESRQGTFEFLVPSGTYTLHAYGEELKGKDVTVNVLPEQRELTVSPIALTASKFVLLQGQPAP